MIVLALLATAATVAPIALATSLDTKKSKPQKNGAFDSNAIPRRMYKRQELSMHNLMFIYSLFFIVSLFFSYFPTDLDSWYKIAQIITSGSILVALLEYFYRRNKDKTSQIANQIAFYLDIIIPLYEEFILLIRSKKPDYEVKRIRLDTPSLKYVRDTNFNNSKEQADLVRDEKILNIQTKLLNRMEELSIRIVHYGTRNHKAINSIKYTFIEIVEVSGSLLLLHREIFSRGSELYSYILELYAVWKDDVDRRPSNEKLEEFISKTK